jgi:cellulase
MRSTTASILAMATAVSAHTRMCNVWVNGADQGDGMDSYIRTPPNNSPVKDLTSPDLVCNVGGDSARADFVSAAAGDVLSFEWFHDNRGDDIIDGSHEGPIITYIAEFTEGAATGAIWTKIAEDGYDGSEWAVDKLKANGGLYDFTIPDALKAGKYLIRQEIIAHHESDAAFDKNPVRGAQFYPSCVQVEITSGGSAVPDQDFDFNTGYTYADPGIVFNLYGAYTSYSIPGPEVWSGEGGSSPAPEDPEEPETPAPTTTAVPSTTAAPAPTSTSGAANPPASPTATLITITTSGAPAPTGAPTPTETPDVPPPAECPARRRKRSSKNKRSKKTRRSSN